LTILGNYWQYKAEDEEEEHALPILEASLKFH